MLEISLIVKNIILDTVWDGIQKRKQLKEVMDFRKRSQEDLLGVHHLPIPCHRASLLLLWP